MTTILTTNWEVGTISSVSGSPLSSGSTARTQEIIAMPQIISWDDSTGYGISVFYYDENDVYLKANQLDVLTSPCTLTPPSTAKKVRIITARYPTKQTITDEILESITAGYSLTYSETPPVDPPVDPPLEPKTVTSAQSGNWEDTTTWVGGVIPNSEVDDIIVDVGHTVTLNESLTIYKSLLLQGELFVSGENVLTLGTVAPVFGTINLSGGKLSGLGTLDFVAGTIKSEGEEWSEINIANVTSTPTSNTFMNWQCNKVKFTSSLLHLYRSSVLIDGNPSSFSISNCVFKGVTTMHILKSGWQTAQSAIEFTRCTFDECDYIQLSTTSFKAIFNTCTFTHSTGAGTFKLNNAPIEIRQSVFVDVEPSFLGEGYLIEDCFFVKTMSSGGESISGTAGNYGVFRNNYVYANSETYNNRAVNHPVAYGNFVEDRGHGGGNSYYSQLPNIEWLNNFLIADLTDSFTTMPSSADVVVDYNISNNTIVNKNAVNSERYNHPEGSFFNVYNNLHVQSDADATDTLFHTTINGLTDITVDYKNNYSNSDSWYPSTITPLESMDSNVRNKDNNFPAFFDASRNIIKYAQTHSLGNEYTDVVGYFASINGYNKETGYNTDEILSETSIKNFVDWLKEGYTPTNMALATAGDGGTYVGAVMPVATSASSVSFNGTEITAVNYNGQAINTINVNGVKVVEI